MRQRQLHRCHKLFEAKTFVLLYHKQRTLRTQTQICGGSLTAAVFVEAAIKARGAEIVGAKTKLIVFIESVYTFKFIFPLLTIGWHTH